MNRERTKELLPIMTAFVEGKEIEFRVNPSESWRTLTDPNWGESAHCYRIKPSPKMRVMTRGEVLYVLSTEHCVLSYSHKEPFLLVEAIEEDVTMDIFMKNLPEYRYAIIDSHGNPINGWHKFEIADSEEAQS